MATGVLQNMHALMLGQHFKMPRTRSGQGAVSCLAIHKGVAEGAVREVHPIDEPLLILPGPLHQGPGRAEQVLLRVLHRGPVRPGRRRRAPAHGTAGRLGRKGHAPEGGAGRRSR